MGEGKEGDWECGGCNNRSYAFRSFCNRCKLPRLLVDCKTPADSKWLPRIGDWICSGCTNNNYASRETCKKCGQAKEVAAMPAVVVPGASFPTYSHYFARAHNYAIQSSSTWPLGGTQLAGSFLPNPANHHLSIPKGWRNGDWMCSCGFHNYSSRAQCKSCNASSVPALGTKRLASEELSHDWENKRLNSGNTNAGLDQVIGGTIGEVRPGIHSTCIGVGPNWQIPPQVPVPFPALLGKGAKQWRNGDWMCTKCNNHNYASRSECNRCKMERDAVAESFVQPVNAV